MFDTAQPREGMPQPIEGTPQPGDITYGIVAETLAPVADNMPDAAIAAIAQEITDPPHASDPTSIVESVDVGGIAFPVRFLTWKYERHWTRILAPMMRFLLEAASVGKFEEALVALLSESDADLSRMAAWVLLPQVDVIADLPAAPEQATGTPDEVMVGRIEEWLGEHARMEELVDVVTAQVRKNKVSDSLGKLWGPGVLSVKTLRGLNTLANLTGSATTQP